MNPFFVMEGDGLFGRGLQEVAILPVIPYFSWGFKF